MNHPLALTIMTTAGHINNKHLTFSLIKRSAEQGKDFMDHSFLFQLFQKTMMGIIMANEHLIHDNHKSYFSPVNCRGFASFFAKSLLTLLETRLDVQHVIFSWNCFTGEMFYLSAFYLHICFSLTTKLCITHQKHFNFSFRF